jgi:hypothetical protein
MKVVALLIFWSLPVLFTGEPGLSPPLSASATAGAHLQVTPAVIQQPTEATLPGDPLKLSLGSPFWDEEDSLDDHFMDGGLAPDPLRWASVRDSRFWFAHERCHFVRSHSRLLPLRC